MSAGEANAEIGTAYGLKPITQRKKHLTEVGAGTPMGELMRRYWQPVFTSAALTSDKPRRARILGEDLIVFRDKQGRPGLVFEHCLHRGTSLYYGRIEDDGIRCCNHGWKFDCQGNCLEQPAEPGAGQSRQKYRQPWYHVEERYGLVWAYMGPPEKKPVLPRWALFEDLADDEYIEVRVDPGYGDTIKRYEMSGLPINWLPTIEQTMDTAHVPWLHYQHSGDQFTGVRMVDHTADEVPPYGRVREVADNMLVERTETGVTQGSPMPGPDGTIMLGRIEMMLPNCATILAFFDMMIVVPMDDDSCVTFLLWRSKKGSVRSDINELHDGKTWWEMTEEEHQAMPGDYEAQTSMPAPASTFEHFAQADKAIVNLRRRLEEALADVAAGKDPPGISFDPDAPPRVSNAFRMRPAKPEEIKNLSVLQQAAL